MLSVHAHACPDPALNLALAVIHSSVAPMMLLDADLTLCAASKSFCRAFGFTEAALQGKTLRGLGQGEWNFPQLDFLLMATAAGHTEIVGYEVDLKRADQPDHRLVLDAHRLDYGAGQPVWLVLSVSDVTEVRAAEQFNENMLKEKAILLQELQHRTANSLQIVASLLMQSVRKVNSDESRGPLHEAHQRVLSVAALQHHLASSPVGDVKLQSYFTTVCDNIAASMIGDKDKISVQVTVDDSVTSPDTSVSLGLIVTEMVINAIKHAFPGDRFGRITVDYLSHGPNWVLSVTDNGIGMPLQPAYTRAGLGSSIVRALAARLHAVITVTDANPGTVVTIAHTHAVIAPAPQMADRAV